MHPRHTRRLAIASLFAALGTACNGGQGVTGLAGGDASQSELSAAPTYMVQANMGPGLCLVPSGGVTANGTALSLGDCKSPGAMGWALSASNALVLAGNRCVDVMDGSSANGTLVQLWDCFDENANQRWTLSGNQLVWVGQNKCLDVTDGVTTPEVKLQIWDCDALNDHQAWHMVAAPSVATAVSSAAAAALAASGNNTNPATSAQAGNGNTAGDSNVAASPNAVASPAPTPAPAPTYVAADLSTLTTAWVRQSQVMSNPAASQACMTVAGFPSATTVQSAACGQGSAQTFAADGNGRLRYPSQNLTTGGRTYGRGTYCLTAADPGRVGARMATLATCNSGDANQLWGQAGSSVVSMTSRTCLSAAGSAGNANALTLGACTTNPLQAWTLSPAN